MAEKLVGLMGWPVAHSLSPKMHNYAFSALGLCWRYVYLPVKVEPARRREAVRGLRSLGFMGANVTVPHKEAVVPFMDSVSEEASHIGAVNTIEVKDEKLIGHNTDARGFINDLTDHGIEPKNLKVLLLGAGGSARAIAYGLLAAGCNITVLNRTKEKADQLALSLSSIGLAIKTDTLNAVGIKNHAHADLIINTTSVGLANEQEIPWDENISFSKQQVVYDIIYGKPTKLLQHAASSGAQTINGLGMLVHQGALSFSIWTGLSAPVELMQEALQRPPLKG